MSTSLRQQIIDIRKPIANTSLKFVPHRSILALLSPETISTALYSTATSPLHIPSLTQHIIAGGRKVFAILVLLKSEEAQIEQFIKHDQLAPTSLDSRLPFTLEALETIVPNIAGEFFEKQWEFCAPIFSKGVLHRELHNSIHLPFVSEKNIDSGGFGDVYCFELDGMQQTLPFTEPEDVSPLPSHTHLPRHRCMETKLMRKQNLRAVRKEFTSVTSGEDDWAKELHNLSLLSELKHPNMVELLCSYTHLKKHNLVFRLVNHGTMHSLFENSRPVGFDSDEAFFHSLAQLASAICAVHAFTIKRLDLKYIGCHHDLKPKNILFSGQTFILSDFGLSRFSDASESSKEKFEAGHGFYMAPECVDPEDDFRGGIISRPSDIWSFGCIIAEVVTYLLCGKDSVAEFKAARRVKIGVNKTSTFHAGQNTENMKVARWLNELEIRGGKFYKMAIELIRRMLSLDPEKRPKAGEVSFELGRAALLAYNSALEKLFTKMFDITDSVEADMERRRFKIWSDMFESILEKQNSQYRTSDDPMTMLDPVLRCLSICKDEISSILERYATALSPLYSSLRSCIDQLHDFLPGELSKIASSQLEIDLVKSSDATILESMSQQYAAHSTAERVSMLLTIKRMSILVFQQNRRHRPELFIENASNVKIDGNRVLGEHSLADVKETGGSVRRVLVEWIRYTPAWEGPVSEEMMARVEGIAVLLNNRVKPIDQVLHCSGYFHEPNRFAFGVIYEFPPSPGLVTPLTLADVIQATMDIRHRPPLEDRFSLAHQLTKSVIDCHKVGWMHERISAHNIAFFHSSTSHPSTWIQNGFIVGFIHSRPNDPKAFTLGPGMSRFQTYHHPEYERGARFVIEFDYYSLGLVLLEIGLWRPLHKIIEGWKFKNLEELREQLLEKRVPLLMHAMGRGYCEAVEICLGHILEEWGEVSMGIEVLKRLGKCPYEEILGAHQNPAGL